MYCTTVMSGGGLGADIVCTKHVKHVWGLRPHIFFTLLLRNLGPRATSGHNLYSTLV